MTEHCPTCPKCQKDVCIFINGNYVFVFYCFKCHYAVKMIVGETDNINIMPQHKPVKIKDWLWNQLMKF